MSAETGAVADRPWWSQQRAPPPPVLSLTALGGTAAAGASFAPTHTVRFGGNWAGYVAAGSVDEFVSAAADWTVPAVTCLAKHDLYAPWVGIDGYNSDTVEQTGVATSCSTGSPVESAWYEMYPAEPTYYSNPISTGDTIAASVTSSGTKFTLKISDVTKGWTETTKKSLSSAEKLSAEAVIEAPGGYPKITSVSFTNVLFNGRGLKSFDPVKTTSGGYKPGKITHGDDFSIT